MRGEPFHKGKCMRIAIADDSRADSAHLTKELMTCFAEMGYEQEEPEVYDSGEALLAVFSAGLYDFIFLDICMNENGLSGIDTAKEIRKKDSVVRIAFITSSNDYAAESYAVSADYYLLKPYDTAAVRNMLRNVDLKQYESERYLVLPDDSKFRLQDIIYTEYSNHKVVVHLADGSEHGLWTSQAEMEKLMCSRGEFATCTKGIIVNLEAIENIDEDAVRLRGGAVVPTSRGRRSELKQLHAEYLFRNLRGRG